ncbi:MAG TPA: hypothetical protein VFL14_10955 [Xanthomonadales bacterium]|nr:hypothetical protein [Xanthomonadales bacterium]
MSPIRREDIMALAAFERDRGGGAAMPDAVVDRLVGHRFLEIRGGMPLLTMRGRTELARRRALDRKSGA